MKKKKSISLEGIIIINDTKKLKLPYGDYLRIVSFLPNLKYKKIFFYCNDQQIINLLREVDFIKIIKKHEVKKLEIIKKKYFVFNIGEFGKNTNKTFYLKSIINSNKNYKQNMADLIKNLSKYFKIKKYKFFYNKKKNKKISYDIFFSWRANNSWKMKEYPFYKLMNLKKKIESTLKVKIKLQSKNEKMKQFINNIKKSDIIISIVNLGCHIANLFDKKLIMLSGPNYHEDSNMHKNQITIFPKEFCELHKNSFKYRKYKNRVGLISNSKLECQCMNNIDADEVLNKLGKLVNGKI